MPKENAPDAVNEQQSESKLPASPQTTPSLLMPITLSSLALLLAAFALTIALTGNKNIATHHPMANVENKLAGMETRVNHMEAMMVADKHRHVQTKLKKMLLSLHTLSRLGDNSTQSEISKVEAILQRLSTPATRIKAKVDLSDSKKLTHPAAPKMPAAIPNPPKPANESSTPHLQLTPIPAAPKEAQKIPSLSTTTSKSSIHEKTPMSPASATTDTPPASSE